MWITNLKKCCGDFQRTICLPLASGININNTLITNGRSATWHLGFISCLARGNWRRNTKRNQKLIRSPYLLRSVVTPKPRCNYSNYSKCIHNERIMGYWFNPNSTTFLRQLARASCFAVLSLTFSVFASILGILPPFRWRIICRPAVLP